MSDDLYRVRCWFDGHRGIARCCGVTIELECLPMAARPNPDVVEMAYAPLLHVFLIRERTEARRDMTPAESAHVDAWLHRMAIAAREHLEA